MKTKKIMFAVITAIAFLSVTPLFQSCSNEDTSMENNMMGITKTDKIVNRDISTVIDSIFTVKSKMQNSHINIKVCDNLVTSIINESQSAPLTKTVKNKNIRFKAANKETVDAGWTYLGEVKGAISAIKLFNEYKEKWNLSCLELRLESENSVTNVYIRKCE